MSTTRVVRFAIVAFAVAGLCGAGCAQPEPIATLTYEVDRDKAPDADDAPIDVERLLAVVNERIEGVGKARALGDDKFAVDVYDQGEGDEASIHVVRRLLDAYGHLEFRIMASPAFRWHDAIIESAEALSADEVVVEDDDVVVAQWIDCDRMEFPDAEQVQERGLVVRKAASGLQALVLTNDELDVDGSYLKTVTPDVDETGRPQVSFTFNAEGAFLFGQLTGEHVPTVTGQEYSLGVILDKVLLSAPTIQSKITDRGRISGGNMTEEDVEYLVAVLQSGRLPYAVREVGAAAQDEP